MEHDVRDRLTWRIVLQRHRRLVLTGHLQRNLVRGYFSERPSVDQQSSTRCIFFSSRFLIELDGSLTVSVGPRQAIAVHTAALGSGGTPTAQQVPIMFSENATTTFGEVSARWSGVCLIIYLYDRTSSWWAARRSSVPGTRPMRYVRRRIRRGRPLTTTGTDTTESSKLSRVGSDGVSAAEHHVRVQVHPQRV